MIHGNIMESSQDESNFYFFQQTSHRHGPTKRYRKLPDDLPESLKYAHLHPKVAQLYAQRERDQKAAEQDPFGDGLGKKSLIPNINQAVTHIKNRLDSALSNDEDSQRYLFEDSKAGAGNILQQLAKYLYYYDNIVNVVPKSLEYQLMIGWKELTNDVNYVPREWQTSEIKEQYYSSLKEAHSDEESDGEGKQAKNDKDAAKTDSKTKTKKSKTSIPDIIEETIPDKPPKRSESRMSVMSVSKSRLDTKPSGGRLSREPRGSKLNARRGRLKKVSGLRSPAIRKSGHDDSFSNIGETPSDPRSTAMTNPGFPTQTSIFFSLTSKISEEKGWIVQKGNKDEIDKNTVLEYCVQLLNESIKKTKELKQQEAEKGHDKPAIVRYYGDQRKEALLKFRKSPYRQQVSPIYKGGKPKIPPMYDDRYEGKKLMQTGHLDGTSFVYYPSGRIAIVYCSAGIELGRTGYYVMAFDDTPDNKMLLCFTPSGRGVCYATNGNIKFLATEKGGHIADSEGSVLKKWKWPINNMKIFSPESIQLNPSMIFRCNSQTSMSLTFNHQKEVARFSITPTPWAINSKTDENEHLLTTFTFSSRAAKDLMRLFAPKPKSKPKKQVKKQKPHIAEIQKLLDLPDKVHYEIEADKDLARLQRKARNLVDDWLEHYRLTIGLKSPHILGLKDTPEFSVRRRNIQSAQLSENGQNLRRMLLGLESKEQSMVRAPSAPLVKEPEDDKGIVIEVPKQSRKSARQSAGLAGVKFEEHEEDAGGEGGAVSPTAMAVLDRLSHSAGRRSAKSVRTPISSAPLSRQNTATNRTDTLIQLAARTPCPIAVRQQMLGLERPLCRCSRHFIPQIMDLEYDEFIQNEVPENQMIVIEVISSLYPHTSQADDMIEKLCLAQNRNRTKPCVQGRNDTYRILQYDINTAAEGSDHTQPLLLTRHNVVPGMFLIYLGGKLLFCDHIFNGYGNAKKDFKKQLMKCRIQGLHGFSLPRDFRFSPGRGKSGMRSAWGGEIGGTGVDHYGSPGTSLDSSLAPLKRSSSSISGDSKEASLEQVKDLETARIIAASLSPGGYKLLAESHRHFSAPHRRILQEPVM